MEKRLEKGNTRGFAYHFCPNKSGQSEIRFGVQGILHYHGVEVEKQYSTHDGKCIVATKEVIPEGILKEISGHDENSSGVNRLGKILSLADRFNGRNFTYTSYQDTIEAHQSLRGVS